MGASALGSIEYTVARAYLASVGVDFSTINWVAMRQTTNMIAALKADQIDAAWLNMASAVSTLALAHRCLRPIEGNRALYKDRAFFDRVVEKWMPSVYTQQQKQLLYNAYRPSWGINGGLNMAAMTNVLEDWKSSVNPERANNAYFSRIDDLVDRHFAKDALAKLGVLDGALDNPQWLH